MGRFSTRLKKELRDKTGCGCFHIFRWLERGLPVSGYHSLLKPVFRARTFLNTWFKPALQADPVMPAFLQRAGSSRMVRRQRTAFYLNHVLACFPDRLARPKWRTGCSIEGLEHLQMAKKNGRPVVVAFCHFGAFYLLGTWLRAAGLPAAVLVGVRADRDTRLRDLKDRYSPFPHFPTVFYANQLREVNAFLAGGNQLLIAVDVPSGKQMRLPFEDHSQFQMSTGAVRLAIRHEAELISCSIIDLGGWRFQIKFGRPVPREWLNQTAEPTHAGNHLLNDLLPLFKTYPEQCTVHLTRCLKTPAGGGRANSVKI
jgi:hypothetical protein